MLLTGALLTTWAGAWEDVGHFFTNLTASGLTGLLAALTAALFAGRARHRMPRDRLIGSIRRV